MHDLARLLPNGAQRHERTYRLEAGLLPKLPAGSGQQLLTRLGQTLWYGPGTGIATFPEGAAGMRQKYFESAGSAAIQQQSRTGRLRGQE